MEDKKKLLPLGSNIHGKHVFTNNTFSPPLVIKSPTLKESVATFIFAHRPAVSENNGDTP